MEIVWKNPANIIPYDQNPRLNDSAVAAVAASIREFGFQQPIVVDREWVIIAGHTRHKAALSLDLDRVPVVVAGDLTPDQIRAYRIADNKTGELADWDFEVLATEVAALTEAQFDGSLLGFSETDLSKLLGGEQEQEPISQEPIDKTGQRKSRKKPRDENATQPGDVWLLGEHRLHCGDASRHDNLEHLIEFLIAAEQIERHACVFERSASACDAIIHQWEKLTGRTAQRQNCNPPACRRRKPKRGMPRKGTKPMTTDN